MILYTNGCSFTWGDELSNRNSRYASLLSNKLNYELVDNSMCGSSNERILRTTFDYLQDPKTDLENLLVVIGWSGISRTELYNDGVDALVIDTAHAHSKLVVDTLVEIKSKFKSIDCVVGNVATPEAASLLISKGPLFKKNGLVIDNI